MKIEYCLPRAKENMNIDNMIDMVAVCSGQRKNKVGMEKQQKNPRMYEMYTIEEENESSV